MMSAVLSNPSHPKYGVATIPFPIPRDQYTYCMQLLAALDSGQSPAAVSGLAAVHRAHFAACLGQESGRPVEPR